MIFVRWIFPSGRGWMINDMEKIKIELPHIVLFRTEFNIAPDDINEAGHMGNERILHHANWIRYECFTSINVMPEPGHGLIVANHSIQYRCEGFLNDTISCEVGVGNQTECSFDLFTHFVKNPSGKTLAVVRSGLIYFDYQYRKIRHLPKVYGKIFS
jgi:acyl-CoA thioester hydrolase